MASSAFLLLSTSSAFLYLVGKLDPRGQDPREEEDGEVIACMQRISDRLSASHGDAERRALMGIIQRVS
jgi:hypothetical protein